jgi:hypothetical protein
MVLLTRLLLGCGTPGWTLLPDAGAPEPASGPHGVAADDLVLFWGGSFVRPWVDATEDTDGGGAWDVAAGTWIDLPPSDGGPTDYGSVVWTGEETFAWGGYVSHLGVPDEPIAPTGRSYDPATQAWRPISEVGAPDSADYFTAVWTGEEVLVWGGERTDGCLAEAPAAWDPDTDTWRPISMAGGPSPRAGYAAVWTGTEMLVWGGLLADADLSAERGCPEAFEHSTAHHRETGDTTDEGHAYDPATDTWRRLESSGSPPPQWWPWCCRYEGTFWTGEVWIVWGGADVEGQDVDGGVYDPVLDSWSGAPPERDVLFGGMPKWWDGTFVNVWTGDLGCTHLTRFDPFTGRVERLRAPPWEGQTAVWTGDRLVAWGVHFWTLGGPERELDDVSGWLYEP